MKPRKPYDREKMNRISLYVYIAAALFVVGLNYLVPVNNQSHQATMSRGLHGR